MNNKKLNEVIKMVAPIFEVIKILAPVLGGLAIGDGIARIYENNFFGFVEIIFGLVVLAYTFYLIFKK